MNNTEKDDEIAKLKAELIMLKTVMSLLPGNVFWVDSDGFIRGSNINNAKTFGNCSPEEFVGRRMFDVFNPEMASEVQQTNLDVIVANNEKSIEELWVDEAGNEVVYLSQKTPFYDNDGKLQGILGVSFDVTDRKRMEDNLKKAKKRALAASRAKSKFLAMISHELRIPLTSILGFANFLEHKKMTSQQQRQYVQNIIDSGSYLLSLINNLLDYSSQETRNTELANNPLPLKKFMQSVIVMLRDTAKAKGLSLLLRMDPNLPESVLTDSRVLRQVVTNLVGNAIKFTHKGHVSLSVNVLKSTSKSVRLRVEVEDTGIGIPLKEQKLIFKQFYQLGNVFTRDSSLTGAGLGLAIVKNLVNLMGGKIKVKSVPEKGSLFYFDVDFKLPGVEKVIKTKSKPKGHKSGSHLRVLLVEDNLLVQIVHKRMLEELGLSVDVVDSATKALEKMNQPYDLLFVDIGLPDMDGFSLIKKIKRIKKEYQPRSIVVLTGYSDKEAQRRCFKAGANEVVIKPVSLDTLQKVISRYTAI